ncbi:hypothetical protein EHO59_06735 [Leptospira semungkisensis]|uniref:Uncharacterized protein n=1 Tax=Leptospira semungkisensis TaxID=2484985 RepID=A0A4V3JCX6_9LEPT|nr:hypothetical protein [Leptospira semungkisensis]TGK07789.1 hypothetical protein EHO59_06735 [Leptospira semungkisensis]
MLSSRVKLTVIVIFFLLPFIGLIAELQTIYLRNGQILRGEVIQQTATSMQIKLEDGKILKLNKSEIQRISFKEPTAKEKKDAEEKTKQIAPTQPEVVQEPLPTPSSSPAIAAIPITESPYYIDQAKRNDLELYFGVGMGKYQPAPADFLDKVQSVVNLISGGGATVVGNPSIHAMPAEVYGANYTWKRFSGGLSGMHVQSKGSHRTTSYTSTDTVDIYGSYPDKQSSLKGDLSFLAFTSLRVDLRPTIGYQYFWAKSQDPGSTVQDTDAAGLSFFGNYQQNFTEHLRGYSYGLKASVRMRERWENRFEVNALSLNGDQNGNVTITLLHPTNPAANDIQQLNQPAFWKAKGFQFSYRLYFKYTPTLSFWTGFQAYEWKYSLDSYTLNIYSAAGSGSSPPDQVLLQYFIIGQAAKSVSASSKTTILEFGITKRFEFSSK